MKQLNVILHNLKKNLKLEKNCKICSKKMKYRINIQIKYQLINNNYKKIRE